MRNGIIVAVTLLGTVALGACDREVGSAERMDAPVRAASGAEQAAATGDQTARVAAEAGEIVVYKSPTCGCCNDWIAHLESEGFDVRGVDIAAYADLSRKKMEHGVPGDLGSCHTARVAGYTVEGHVPAEVVARLLRERPADIVGLSVPGMPIGSPGMEGPNPQVYQVIAFDAEGNRRVYETIDPR